jgi:iron complex outermembrane receptor protein
MKTNSNLLSKNFTAIAVVVLATTNIQDVTAGEVGTAADRRASNNAIEEVIVTATKREKSFRDVPASITAYSGEELMASGKTSLEEIMKSQPGTSKNGYKIVVRGVATSALGSYGTSEEVGRFLDDISLNTPAGRGLLVDVDPFDMESVEIDKGPLATLFGGTALSGAVRYIPTRPDTSESSGKIRAAIGSVDHAEDLHKEYGLVLNLALADSLALRAVGSKRTRPGVIDDLRNGQKDIDFADTEQYRIAGLWQVSDKLGLEISYFDYVEERGDLGFTDQPDKYEISIRTADQPFLNEATLMSARLRYQFDDFSLKFSASDLNTRFFDIADVLPLVGAENDITSATLAVDALAPETRSYELRIVSDEPTSSPFSLFSNWSYVAGIFKMEADQIVDAKLGVTANLAPTLPTSSVGDGSIPVNLTHQITYGYAVEDALFFDLSRAFFASKLEVNIGGRLARSELKALQTTSSNGATSNPVTSEEKDDRYNPKYALTWSFSDDLSVYTSAAEGFRFSGVNTSPTVGIDIPRTFKSDTLWNYEIGVRSDWFDSSLQLDLTLFKIDWDNLQVQQVSDTAQNYVDNIGSAQIKGSEASFRWNLPNNWSYVPAGLSINIHAGYIDATTQEDFDSTDGPVASGTRLPLTPKKTLNSSLAWRGNLGSWDIGASVDFRYASSRPNQLVPTATLPSYHSSSLTLSVANSYMSLAPKISLAVTNLRNETVQNFAFAAEPGPNTVYTLNRPRTILLNVQFDFN